MLGGPLRGDAAAGLRIPAHGDESGPSPAAWKLPDRLVLGVRGASDAAAVAAASAGPGAQIARRLFAAAVGLPAGDVR